VYLNEACANRAAPTSWKRDLYARRKETIELLFRRVIQASDLRRVRARNSAATGSLLSLSQRGACSEDHDKQRERDYSHRRAEKPL
jgi:hypothetical protein